MTPLMGARRRAEEFARLVDGVPDEQGGPRPELVPELSTLVGLVDTLREIEHPVMRPAVAADLRERLMAEAETALAASPAPPRLALPTRRPAHRERRLALLASSVVLVGGSAGMAAAASGSVEGDSLYPLKRGLERVELLLNADDAARGQDLLAHARTRLEESAVLVAGDAPDRALSDTLADFATQADEGTRLLLSSYAREGDESDVEQVRGFLSDSLTVIAATETDADGRQRTLLAQAAEQVLALETATRVACPDCGPELPALDLGALVASTQQSEQVVATMRARSGAGSGPSDGPSDGPGAGPQAAGGDGAGGDGSSGADPGDNGITGIDPGDLVPTGPSAPEGQEPSLPDLPGPELPSGGGIATGGPGDVIDGVQDGVEDVEDAVDDLLGVDSSPDVPGGPSLP